MQERAVAVVGGEQGLRQVIEARLRASGAQLVETPAGAEAVVVVVGGDAIPGVTPITDLDADGWHRSCESLLRKAMVDLQSAHRAFAGTGGRVVVVVATVGFVGAAGLVAYTAAIEGVRAMAKSAARQWAVDGVGVTMVAVPLGALAPGVDRAVTGHFAAAASGDEAHPDEVAAVIDLLLSPQAPSLPGVTVVADGGSVMAP